MKNGVSGIPVFQLCRVAAKALDEKHTVMGEIDFVPELSDREVKAWIEHYGVEGILPQKWVPFCKQSKNELDFVKKFQFKILDTFGMERAQVTAGGVPIKEINPSYGIPYLYPFCSSSVNDDMDWEDSIFRLPLSKMKRRPIFTRPDTRRRKEEE